MGIKSKSFGRVLAALVLSALVAAVLVTMRTTATAAIPGDPLCVAKPATVASGATRILTIGDSLTSAASGDYTWRYFLWKQLVNPNGVASPAPAAYNFVGPHTKVVDPVNLTRTSDDYNCDFDKDNAAEPGSLMTAYLEATNLGLSTKIQDLVNKPDGTSDDADVLIVFGGVNDLSKATSGAYDATVAQVIAREQTIAAKAQAANPSIKIVFVTAPAVAPPPNPTQLQQRIASFNTLLKEQAPGWSTPNSPVVVANAAQNWSTSDTTYDLIHPNPKGEFKIANDIATALSAVSVGSGPAATPANWNDYYVGPHQAAILAQPTVDGAGAHLSWTLPSGSIQSRVFRKDFTIGTDYAPIGALHY